MHFSRTSAAITPKLFSDMLQVRETSEFERISTVKVEETRPAIEAAASSCTPSSCSEPGWSLCHEPRARVRRRSTWRSGVFCGRLEDSGGCAVVPAQSCLAGRSAVLLGSGTNSAERSSRRARSQGSAARTCSCLVSFLWPRCGAR